MIKIRTFNIYRINLIELFDSHLNYDLNKVTEVFLN